MTRDAEPAYDVDAWGIQTRWVDAHGQRLDVAPEILARLRDIIKEPTSDVDGHAPIVTRPGRDLAVGAVDVECEDGTVRHVDGPLPPDFPVGYHTLRGADGQQRRLIVSPGRCWLPDGWRAWGWTVQLYAARSSDSWGIGDLSDLRKLREWSQSLGAGFMLVNPLHAVAPTMPQEDSPYLPATRRFRNPIYLCVDELAAESSVDVTALAKRGRALNDAPVIDRDAVWRLKRDALWRVFSAPHVDDGFDAWRQQQGESLQEFALWCALADEHGPDWREWDSRLHDPGGDAVRRFTAASEPGVTFHAWLQWHLDRQLRDASGDFTILQDLPIGVAAGGADAWAWQDLLARGATIGAPPDLFNTAGQDWESPPLTPWRLRAHGYHAFVETIRATMAHAGGLRIDHVMGLFRLWWVAPGESPVNGAYVRYPSEDLLDIVALESHRANAIVVGEDLGTVEPGVRTALADHRMLSYRLLYFEDDDPRLWPGMSMAAVTTHDLPTVAGLWTGQDNEDQAEHTTTSAADLERGRRSLLDHLAQPGELASDATVDEAVEAAYRRLAEAPCVLLSATLEDAVGVERRPNIPGAQRDNWCLPMPVRIDDLPTHELALRVAGILGSASAVRAAR